MLRWSRQQFEQDAKCLVQAMQKHNAVLQKQQEEQHSLLQWTAETAADGSLYLVHPPVSRRNDGDIVRAAVEDANDDNNEEEDLLCDDAILQDDPDVLVDSHSNNNRHDKEEKHQRSAVWWHFYFSIVYSDTWQVPILYFTVDHQTNKSQSSPCARTQVLDLLMQFNHNNHQEVEDSWDFLSHEEHPISRIPSYFLHPCQTRERLQTLLLGPSLQNTTPQQSINSDHGDNQHHPNLLLHWMSMILPSVGYPLSAKVFQQLKANATPEN